MKTPLLSSRESALESRKKSGSRHQVKQCAARESNDAPERADSRKYRGSLCCVRNYSCSRWSIRSPIFVISLEILRPASAVAQLPNALPCRFQALCSVSSGDRVLKRRGSVNLPGVLSNPVRSPRRRHGITARKADSATRHFCRCCGRGWAVEMCMRCGQADAGSLSCQFSLRQRLSASSPSLNGHATAAQALTFPQTYCSLRSKRLLGL
ncbi:hypothetical protein DFH06DRAFT_564541 [Mycena polygramma]|nr:hypothetical protein DFH06DRAFT_564541 [Mycena polygramma]